MTTLPRVPYDPVLIAGQEAFLAEVEPEPLRASTILATRARFGARTRPVEEALYGRGVIWEQREIPGPQGAPDIPILIVSPDDHGDRCPGIYNIHGGGMMVGDHLSSATELADLAEQLGTVGVSVRLPARPGEPTPSAVRGLLCRARMDGRPCR